jgi:predicted helicase
MRGNIFSFEKENITKCLKRPFFKPFMYFHKGMNDEIGYFKQILQKDNTIIGINSNSAKFVCLVSKDVIDFASLINAGGQTQCLPLYRYSNGERVENITDWALSVFREQYSVNSEKKLITDNSLLITKLDIFHYVYAVLHKPEYRNTYEQNLKREFPRIPLYADFWKYAEAGKKLMELHINYENLSGGFEPPDRFSPLLQRKDIDLEGFKAGKAGKKKKTSDADKEVAEVATAFTVYPILKIKDNNIEIDELTMLCGVPAQALAYKLGNRSAIEWILDQYKPYKSDDKTIQEQFNNYNFADYKEQVIELLQKVCWLSVETMKIVGEL